MAAPAYVSDPSIQFLQQVLDEIAKAYVQIPAFQRSFVWSDDQRIDLLESIRDGIPIGSILVWRTARTDLKCVTQIGPHFLPSEPKEASTARSYLLDGFQRMSTLYGCLRPLVAGASPFTVDDDGEEVSWRVGYDLAEEQFSVLDKGIEAPPAWLPLPILLDSVGLLRFQRRLDSDSMVQRADELAETFRTYKLPVIPVVTDNLAGATRTFERINRQGTPMTELQMVRALTYTKEFDLTQKLMEARQSLEKVGWGDIDPEIVLRTTKAALDLDVSIATPDELADKLTKNASAVVEAPASLARAASWLRLNCGVPSHRVVPYLAQVILLADALRLAPTPKAEASDALRRWFWQTTYTGEFRGLSGGRLMKQLRRVRAIALGQPADPPLVKGTPDFHLPPRFATKQVRIIAAALQLARLGPRDSAGELIDVGTQLSTHGLTALVPIIRGKDATGRLRGIANRIFINPNTDIREQLLNDPTSIDSSVLISIGVSSVAVDAIKRHDWNALGEARAALIEELERSAYEALWEEHPSSLGGKG